MIPLKNTKAMQRLLDFLFPADASLPYRNVLKWFWILTLSGLLIALITFVVLSFSDLPSLKQLENPKSELATLIYSADGQVLGRYYTENRVPVRFDSLSPYLVHALIATEDERYYKHCGIDFPALARVGIKTVLLGRSSSGGGSTITQQLAKLLFTENPARSLAERAFQKLKEWIIAVRLERKYTKEEILAMYLNKFNFIYGAYGIQAASEIYFNKPQKDLRIQEAATLVGMLKNPSLYNPVRRPDTVLHRREVVLKQMQRNNLLSQVEYDSLRQLPLGIDFQRKTHIDGLATYFRAELAKDVRNILNQEPYLKSDGSAYDIYRDGLRIYTTIDAEMQRLAEKAMLEHMAKVQKSFWRVWRNRDPWTYKTSSRLEIPLEVRRESLDQLVRKTDRYRSLRDHYLGSVLTEIRKEVSGITLHEDDRELKRIVREREEQGHHKRLVAAGIISRKLEQAHRRVLNSPHFPVLKKQWYQLQEAVETTFNQPVENMRVFAYTDGLEKDTTMTPLDSIRYHRMFLQTGILAVEPQTGDVKVWIGGVNHKYFQYDHVRTNRQVGSTFKPFIYATAIDQQGISPCFKVYDLPQSIKAGDGKFALQKDWTPRNATGEYTGKLYTLKDGLRKSINTLSVFLMKQLGTSEPVINLIGNMGIDVDEKYPNGQYRVTRGPSLALGATDLTVFEMTGAYTTFANNGTYMRPNYIRRIEDRNGKLIYQSLPFERPALNPNANYVMVEMLKHAAAVYGLESQVGGKTGTTNEYVDGWFMGITPELVVGTWVGGEDRWIRFLDLSMGQGAYMAKPFFKKFVQALEERSEQIGYDPTARFYRPPGDIGIELDCDAYLQGPSLEEDEYGPENPFEEDIFGDEIIEEEAPLPEESK